MPTTLATTSVTGAFTVRGVPVVGADVKVEVTPPAGSGLPRLSATDTFSLTQAVVIAYSPTLVVRDVGGAQVRRGGSPLPGAKVTLVGTLPASGTVTAGVAATASGVVRIAATADAGGVLPATFAPAAALSAVVAATPGNPTDLAVSAIDLGTAVPATIAAPTRLSISTGAMLGPVSLDRARLDLVPVGALALAGTATIHLASDETGGLAGLVASGGRYDAHWFDPAGRAGAEVVRNLDAPMLQAPFALPPALVVSGTLAITGNPNKIVGASVQALCATCSGLERARPLAEAASDQLGGFQLAVPDRGL